MRFFSFLWKNNFFLLFSSAVLYALSFPNALLDCGLPPLVFLSFIAFFSLARNVKTQKKFLWGFCWGLLAFFIICFWLKSYGFSAFFLVSAYMGVLYAILFIVLDFSSSRLSERFFWIFRSFLIFAFEYIRSSGFLGFPYGCTGYAFFKLPWFVNVSSFFGVYGLSLLVILFSSGIEHFIFCKNKSQKKSFALFVLFFAAVSALNTASFYLRKDFSLKAKTLEVCAVQPAFDYERNDFSSCLKDFERLRELTDQALQEKSEIQLVVWPETAIIPDISFYEEYDFDKGRHELSLEILSYMKSKNAAFVTGNNHRETRGDKDLYFNSALFISQAEERIQAYNKSHLIPFAEKIPLKSLNNPLIKKIARSLYSDDFDSGDEVSIFKACDVPFSTPICFEDGFCDLVSDMKSYGAAFLVNITDDSWSDSVSCQNQHLSMSVFRSCENGMPCVRSTVDGKTCFIDRYGTIKKELSSFEKGFLTQKIFIDDEQTFYFLAGRVCVKFFVLLTLLLLIFIRFGKIKSWQMKNRKKI